MSKSCPIGTKKIRKIPKNPKKIPFFHFFSYALVALFVKSRIIIYHVNLRKKCQEKKLKKKWFSFLQTFFLKSILDIFLCLISKLKKKFWKLQLFPFFDSLKNAIYPPKIDISYFFVEIAFLGELLINLHFFSIVFRYFILKNISFIPQKMIFRIFLWNLHFWGNFL